MKTILRLTFCILFGYTVNTNCQSKMVKIKGGTYIPLYGRDSMQVTVSDFLMDVYSVTNQEYIQLQSSFISWT